MNAPGGTLLETRGLTRRFGGLTALGNVDLKLAEGEILGLIGPNGAGKTTLFHLLSGMLRPSAGVIRLGRRRIDGLMPHRIRCLGVARTFQVPRPFLNMTVFENVLVGAQYGGGFFAEGPLRSPAAEAEAALERTGLGDRRDTPASELNLSARRRLELARAIAARPLVLLVDEVAAGLNPVEAAETVALLREIHASGIAMIYVEHMIEAVLELSDRIQVLEHGETIAEGSPGEVTDEPRVIAAYLGRPPERGGTR